MYCEGTLFNDHTSSKIDVFHQVFLGESDTIRSKGIYEQRAEDVGVKILAYRGDNGIYKSKEFKDDLAKRGQTIAYSGLGTYAQNGVAERGVATVVISARAMMLHQVLLWSEQFDMQLWHFFFDTRFIFVEYTT